MGKGNNSLVLDFAEMEDALVLMKNEIDSFILDSENIFTSEIVQLNDMNSDFTEFFMRILESVRDNDLKSIAHDLELYYSWINDNYYLLKAIDEEHKNIRTENANG